METNKAIDRSTTNNHEVNKANKNETNEKHHVLAKSVIDAEIQKFADWGEGWWSEKTGTYCLYTLNEIRVPFVVEKAKETGIIREEFAGTETPLKGLRILDVGCGGGFYSEALAKLGADVVGIDATEDLIKIAKAHQDLDKTLTNLEYKHITLEEFALDNVEAFDVVVCSEVVEHVNDPRSFVLECAKCLKFGGSMIMQTLNKTIWTRLFMIYLLEYILRYLPIGMHDYDLLVSPEDLSDMMAAGGCKTTEVRGMWFNLWTKRWSWISNTQVNYCIHSVKTRN